MSRIRTIKPEWLEDELLAAASDAARTLSVALILLADDYGHGRASIATIAATVWRFDLERDDGARATETLAKASGALRELVAIRFIGCWTESGQRYYAIRNWTRHQRVDKPGKPLVPNRPKLLFDGVNPDGDANSRILPESVASHSRDSREAPAPDLDLDLDLDREGKGAREAEPTGPHPQPTQQPTDSKLTICPLDLPEKAEATGIVRDFVERYGVDAEQVREQVREFVTYWTIGGGMGRQDANWPRKLRVDLKRKGDDGKLRAKSGAARQNLYENQPGEENPMQRAKRIDAEERAEAARREAAEAEQHRGASV